MTEKSARNLAEVDPKYVFTKERPQLIDEWQVVPELWDAVRHECDNDTVIRDPESGIIIVPLTSLRL